MVRRVQSQVPRFALTGALLWCVTAGCSAPETQESGAYQAYNPSVAELQTWESILGGYAFAETGDQNASAGADRWRGIWNQAGCDADPNVDAALKFVTGDRPEFVVLGHVACDHSDYVSLMLTLRQTDYGHEYVRYGVFPWRGSPDGRPIPTIVRMETKAGAWSLTRRSVRQYASWSLEQLSQRSAGLNRWQAKQASAPPACDAACTAVLLPLRLLGSDEPVLLPAVDVLARVHQLQRESIAVWHQRPGEGLLDAGSEYFFDRYAALGPTVWFAYEAMNEDVNWPRNMVRAAVLRGVVSEPGDAVTFPSVSDALDGVLPLRAVGGGDVHLFRVHALADLHDEVLTSYLGPSDFLPGPVLVADDGSAWAIADRTAYMSLGELLKSGKMEALFDTVQATVELSPDAQVSHAALESLEPLRFATTANLTSGTIVSWELHAADLVATAGRLTGASDALGSDPLVWFLLRAVTAALIVYMLLRAVELLTSAVNASRSAAAIQWFSSEDDVPEPTDAEQGGDVDAVPPEVADAEDDLAQVNDELGELLRALEGDPAYNQLQDTMKKIARGELDPDAMAGLVDALRRTVRRSLEGSGRTDRR